MPKKDRAKSKRPPESGSGEPAPCAVDVIPDCVNTDGTEIPDGYNKIGYQVVDNICKEHIM